MENKVITVVGVTGKQGASVADVFLAEGSWKVRGITRNPTKPSSKAWADKGVELVQADLNDAAALKKAFAGSNVIFGVTDFWAFTSDPKVQEQAQASGRPVNELARDLEIQQGKNIVDAASATADTLDRFVLSTLSAAKKWSKGKYTHNYHFDAKWEAVEYLEATYPALAKKTSYLQVALYMTNWKASPLGRPTKQADGTFLLSYPGRHDAPVAMVEPRRDTGHFVKALVQVGPGKNLLGASDLPSWDQYAELRGKIHGVDCRYEPLDRKILENAIPGGIGEELADMFEYIGEFGYHGSDPNVIFPKDLGVKLPLCDAEEYIKSEDWSEII